jgi:tripartite-type tricarboxylate transporter receptor subunit TctC
MSSSSKSDCRIPMMARRQFMLSSLALASVVTMPVVAQTRKFGDRPVRMIVPFAAGGGVDVFARPVSEKLR